MTLDDMTLDEWIEHLRICSKAVLVEMTPKEAGDLSALLKAQRDEHAALKKSFRTLRDEYEAIIEAERGL